MRLCVLDLQPEDTYQYGGTHVTILRGPEDCKDLFGRGMIRFWARRSDTKAEGYVMFGPYASLNVQRKVPTP